MDKRELKKMLKPLIKECIKEVIFEEGVLSGIVSEVLRGSKDVLVEVKKENTPLQINPNEERKRRNLKLQETRSKMLSAMGNEAYAGVFEGTTPLSTAGSPSSPTAPSDPLAAYAPEDEGVNISGLLSIAGDKWGKLRG